MLPWGRSRMRITCCSDSTARRRREDRWNGCGEQDFEDGLIRACAELNDVDVILTRDADAFKRAKVRAMTCAEYLETFG